MAAPRPWKWFLLLLCQSPAVAWLLPAENARGRLRSSRELFLESWDINGSAGALIDGKAPSLARCTDTGLNPTDPAVKEFTVWSYLYPFTWENEFPSATMTALGRRWWWLSYAASAVYLACLWFGQMVMKDLKPFDLKRPLALWNLFLAVFSLLGMLRTVPHLVLTLHSYGFQYTVCRSAVRSFGGGPPGLWATLFVVSKYFELLDTAFLVLRKRKVGFLHWYHHCTVLLYCWHAFIWELSTGIYFITMNFSVHTIMYFYYFLAAVCSRPPPWALLVTVLQISQMAVGIAVVLSHIYMLTFGYVANCDGHLPNLYAALGMYASYFLLFFHFLLERYCIKKRPEKKGKVE